DAGSSTEEPGSGAYAAQCVGEVLRRADDRCARTDYRWTRAHAHPLHAARARTDAAVGATEVRSATAATTEDHRCSGRFRHPRVVPTYDGRSQGNQKLSLDLPIESAKSG